MKKKIIQQLKNNSPFTSVGDAVYDYLKWEIIRFELPPGTRLVETQIANELGISRSPVKFALDSLVEEGLLLKDKYKTPTVAPVNIKDCMQICQARISVEGSAAYYAAKQVTAEQMAHLEELQTAYAEHLLAGKDPMAAAQLDYNLHSEIVNASCNAYIIEMYRCIQIRTLRNRCYVQHMIGPAQSREELTRRLSCHDTLLFALRNGLSEAARSEMTQDINGMIDMFVLG